MLRITSPTLALFGAGLVATLGLFGAGLALTLKGPPPPATAEDPTRPLGQLAYIPLPDPIRATIRGGRQQLTLRVAFAVDSGRVDLSGLRDGLIADLPLLMVELAEAVRTCDEREASLDAFRRALPGVLRAVANERYGTEAQPQPVFEALVTEFAAG